MDCSNKIWHLADYTKWVSHQLPTYLIKLLQVARFPLTYISLDTVPLHDGRKRFPSVKLTPPSRIERMPESIIVCNIYKIQHCTRPSDAPSAWNCTENCSDLKCVWLYSNYWNDKHHGLVRHEISNDRVISCVAVYHIHVILYQSSWGSQLFVNFLIARIIAYKIIIYVYKTAVSSCWYCMGAWAMALVGPFPTAYLSDCRCCSGV